MRLKIYTGKICSWSFITTGTLRRYHTVTSFLLPFNFDVNIFIAGFMTDKKT